MEFSLWFLLTASAWFRAFQIISEAIEVVDLDLQTKMVAELDGHVMRCVRDQNGNHVIQKCIECVPQEEIQFIISSFYDQVVTLSTQPYGCRVIQKVLEHCDDPKTQQIMMDEIMKSVCMLAQDQYGNYVIQSLGGLRCWHLHSLISVFADDSFVVDASIVGSSATGASDSAKFKKTLPCWCLMKCPGEENLSQLSSTPMPARWTVCRDFVAACSLGYGYANYISEELGMSLSLPSIVHWVMPTSTSATAPPSAPHRMLPLDARN